MPTTDEDGREADVPQLALRALSEAQRRARDAGHPLVVVRGRDLVRLQGGTVTLIKKLPARKKAAAPAPRPKS